MTSGAPVAETLPWMVAPASSIFAAPCPEKPAGSAKTAAPTPRTRRRAALPLNEQASGSGGGIGGRWYRHALVRPTQPLGEDAHDRGAPGLSPGGREGGARTAASSQGESRNTR